MDIFKLFYNHDQPLEKLTNASSSSRPKTDSTLADFIKPTPTFSSFYITGTLLQKERFGLSTLQNSSTIIDQLDQVFESRVINTTEGTFQKLDTALNALSAGQPLVIGEEKTTYNFSELVFAGQKSNPAVGRLLQSGAWIMYKVKAPHGFDLHLYSKKNIYSKLFKAFQPLINDHFRFFSINRKRIRTDRHFYFETYTLEKPPHGAEEVFPDTNL